MPRPRKCRRVCAPPCRARFIPCGGCAAAPVVLTLDEYETVRLLDREGLTQEDCARCMGVARTTVTAMYDSARRKLAQFLTEGLPLEIAGGDVSLCAERGGCPCHHPIIPTQKEHPIMKKIAVTYENGQIFRHFGHTEQFKIYTVENGAVTSAAVVNTNGQGHGALGGFLAAQGVDTLICGGIGGGARQALAAAQIALFPGAQGDADAAVAALLAGTLVYDPDTRCHHHDPGANGCHGHEGGCHH